MNGSCEGAVLSNNQKYLYSVGDQAEIYQWDLRTRKVVTKIADEGGARGDDDGPGGADPNRLRRRVVIALPRRFHRSLPG